MLSCCHIADHAVCALNHDVKQKAMLEMDFVITDEYLTLLRQSMTGIVSSQVAEDTFNVMKNGKAQKGKKKFRRVQKCMATVLSRQLLNKEHKYSEIKIDEVANQKGTQPEPETWKSTEPSMPFKNMISTSSITGWYSPGAENWSVRAADLAVIRVCKAKDDFSILDHTWMSTFIRPEHQLVVKNVDSAQWHFAMLHFKDSAACFLPATFEKVQRFSNHHWTWKPDGNEPSFKPVVDLRTLEVFFLPVKYTALCSATLSHVNRLWQRR